MAKQPFHPLEEDLSEVPIDELEKRLYDLTAKYGIAMRFGNTQLLTQMATFVNIYRDALSERYAKQMKEQNQELNDLINVDKN